MSIDSHSAFRVKSLGKVLKLLAEPNRLHILYSLGLECRPVTQIVEATGLEQTNVSFHLRLLREAGLVRAERRGPFIYYCLPDPALLNILEELSGWLGGRQADMRDTVTSARVKPKARSAAPAPARKTKKPVTRATRLDA